jgi:hypothetical protein
MADKNDTGALTTPAPTNTVPATTEKQEAKLEDIAAEFEKTGVKKQGYGYRYVTSGGETHVVANKLRTPKG